MDFKLPLLKPGDHAPNIVRPGRLSALERTAQVERGGIARREAVQNDLFVEAAFGSHDRITFDGHRQHEAVIVVRVFADEVDAARRGDNALGRMTATFREEVRAMFGSGLKGHRKRSVSGGYVRAGFAGASFPSARPAR